MLSVFIAGNLLAAVSCFFSEERPNLKEQLKKLSKRGANGHMKYRFATKLPEYSDFYCHETHGKAK